MPGAASCHNRAGRGRSLGGDAPSALGHEGRVVCGQAVLPACRRCQALAGRTWVQWRSTAELKRSEAPPRGTGPGACSHMYDTLHTGSLFVYAHVSNAVSLRERERECVYTLMIYFLVSVVFGVVCYSICFWDVPGGVLAAPASALRGWTGVIPSLSLPGIWADMQLNMLFLLCVVATAQSPSDQFVGCRARALHRVGSGLCQGAAAAPGARQDVEPGTDSLRQHHTCVEQDTGSVPSVWGWRERERDYICSSQPG